MITPLIKQINKNTLITFPSALEDFNISSNTVGYRKVFFSHFALLNLPDIKEAVDFENSMDFKRIESVFVDGGNIGVGGLGDRLDLSESLQNFMLNYESVLTEQPWYNKDNVQNVSERIFFKWLKEIGAIRYSSTSHSATDGDRFSEEISSEEYNRVVQYISNIGISGKITGTKNSFTEVYVNIPSSFGRTPKVLFKTVSDENYYEGMVVEKGEHSEFINGYNQDSTVPPTGLDLIAQYNRDEADVTYSSEDENGNPIPNWNSYYAGLNTYLTDETFSNPSNDIITMEKDSIEKTFKRSKLDGVQIDFDLNSYKESENQNRFKKLEDLNSQMSSESFEFNAILLYYTIIDETTGESSINLYGISFVGDVVEHSAGISQIERKEKIKSDSNIGNVGNGYGFRFNFKLDARQEDINPNVEIDQFETNTFSMQQFSQTMLMMQEMMHRFEDMRKINEELINRNNSYMDLIQNSELNKTDEKIESLKRLITDQNISDVNGKQLEMVNERIDEILSGRTSVSIDLVTEFVGSEDIDFYHDKNDNKLYVRNKFPDFGEIETLKLNIGEGNVNYIKVNGLKKMTYFECDDTISEDINIIVDDYKTWKYGQSISIVFDERIKGFATVNIYVRDVGNTSTRTFNKNTYTGGIEAGNVLEMICKDQNSFDFITIKR